MPNIPRPNTYIKIKDIEQLKLLCEYKNDKVRPDEEFDLNENIKDFEDGYIYFKWNNDGDGYNTDKYGIDGTYTKLTDDSFLYPNKKPMDKSPKPKKEKQEIFDNQFKVGQYVWFIYNDGEIFNKPIDAFIKGGFYEFNRSEDKNTSFFIQENQLYKTKSQLIKSLSKQWRQEVEERILSLTK